MNQYRVTEINKRTIVVESAESLGPSGALDKALEYENEYNWEEKGSTHMIERL